MNKDKSRPVNCNPRETLFPAYAGEVVSVYETGQKWIAAPSPGEPLSPNDWSPLYEIEAV